MIYCKTCDNSNIVDFPTEEMARKAIQNVRQKSEVRSSKYVGWEIFVHAHLNHDLRVGDF